MNIKKISIFDLRYKEVTFYLKQNKRIKNIKIKIDSDGNIIVLYSKKVFFLEKKVKEFVKNNLEWIFKTREKISRYNNEKINICFTKEEYFKEKGEFKEYVVDRVRRFNKFYNFEYNKIFIKNQKTRWGSCSSKNNLNFNIAILKLPKELQDLIFVHELCHIKEMNHSKNFWALVEKQISNFKELNNELKKYSIKKMD